MAHCKDCEENDNEHGFLDIPADGAENYKHKDCVECARRVGIMKKHFLKYGTYRE